ncbi:MAG: hypothetical protein KGJ90_06855 [Patescibacteria group bacterium]|nr:hypothetical protein [Patescibacteria group bacterium]
MTTTEAQKALDALDDMVGVRTQDPPICRSPLQFLALHEKTIRQALRTASAQQGLVEAIHAVNDARHADNASGNGSRWVPELTDKAIDALMVVLAAHEKAQEPSHD